MLLLAARMMLTQRCRVSSSLAERQMSLACHAEYLEIVPKGAIMCKFLQLFELALIGYGTPDFQEGT
jgi:hypothetical protein